MGISDFDRPVRVGAQRLADTAQLAEALGNTVAQELDTAIEPKSLRASAGNPIPLSNHSEQRQYPFVHFWISLWKSTGALDVATLAKR